MNDIPGEGLRIGAKAKATNALITRMLPKSLLLDLLGTATTALTPAGEVSNY